MKNSKLIRKVLKYKIKKMNKKIMILMQVYHQAQFHQNLQNKISRISIHKINL